MGAPVEQEQFVIDNSCTDVDAMDYLLVAVDGGGVIMSYDVPDVPAPLALRQAGHAEDLPLATYRGVPYRVVRVARCGDRPCVLLVRAG